MGALPSGSSSSSSSSSSTETRPPCLFIHFILFLLQTIVVGLGRLVNELFDLRGGDLLLAVERVQPVDLLLDIRSWVTVAKSVRAKKTNKQGGWEGRGGGL